MSSKHENANTRVLVTGASGFIAIHCVKQLLDEGYKVRGTVRSINNKVKVKPLKDLPGSENLELVEADLTSEGGWPEAVKDCTYILHIASPFPIVADETIIKTAVDGTLNVLRAASKCPSVKKVVITSSCAAINEGHDDPNKVFSEKDWTNVESKTVLNYAKSKTLAEKAAWEFVKENKESKFTMTAINPTLVVGPLLHDVQGASMTIVRRFLNNEMPAVPALSLGLVDVRDVATAHIRAMREPKSDGERILMTAQPSYWFIDIAKVLRKEFSSQGYYVPRFQVPYPLLWLYSFFDQQASQILMRVGNELRFDNSKAQELLGISFTNPDISLIEMAYDLIERGFIPKKRGYRGKPETSSKENN